MAQQGYVEQQSGTSDATLLQHLSRIDDARMRLAFAAAVEIEQAEPTSVGRRSTPESDLWRGLPSRGGTVTQD
jgi:hypothetical protein